MEEMCINETSNHIDENKFEEYNGHRQEETYCETSNTFWSVLQSELNTDIPCYVKNIMRMCHLDKPLSFRCIRDETIEEVEKFVRKSMMYQLMGVEVNLEEYYGRFHKMPNKFRFAIGDRFLIKQLVTCTKSKSDDYWKRVLSPSRHRTIAATTTATATATATTTVTHYAHQHRYHHQSRISDGQDNSQAAAHQQEQDDTNSELEEEEDKPQEEAPANRDQERRKLLEVVRSYLLKEDYGEGIDSRQVAGRVKVRVDVKPFEDSGVLRDLVTGFIRCVFCTTRLMIRKQTLGARKARWVISNYRRHIRFHLDGKLKRPTPQDFLERTTCKPEFYTVNVDSAVHADEQTDDQAPEMEHECEQEGQE